MADALNREVSFTRDADGRVLSTLLPDGRVVFASYDANSNLLTLTPPGRPAHNFSYDTRDLTTQYAPPTATPGGPTAYAYNADSQILSTTRPDGDVLTRGYDLAGRLQTLTLPRGSFVYSYDGASGKLASVSGPAGSTRSYTYQGSLLASLTSGGPVSGTAAWNYDNNFRATARTVNGGNGVTFGYDADDLVTVVGSMSLGRDGQNGLLTGTTLDSVTDALTYSTFGEVSSYAASAGSSQLYSEGYMRDNLGRIIQRTEVLQGTTTTWGYSYDIAGRLSAVTRNGAAFESYTYDQNDNRLTKTTTAGTTTSVYDDQDRLVSSSGLGGTRSWFHDANGDLVSRTDATGTTSFSYDTTGQLLSVTKPGAQVSYELDAMNKRASKRNNGVLSRQWLFAGGVLPVAEYDPSGALSAVFTGSYMIKNGRAYSLIRDHLGSIRLVVDAATGQVVQRMTYGPWGEVLEDTNPGFQPFGYAGGLYDPDTGLVRFGARDYDASIGRWTCKDPALFDGGSGSVYAYCLNDPLNFVDQTGLHPVVTLKGNPVDHLHRPVGRDGKAIRPYTDDQLKADEATIPEAFPGTTLVESFTAHRDQNCHGFTASTLGLISPAEPGLWIQPSGMKKILEDGLKTGKLKLRGKWKGKKRSCIPQRGDLIIYNGPDSRAVHSGIVTGVDEKGDIWVVSDWGDHGIYQHRYDQLTSDLLNNGQADVEIYSVRP